MKTTLFRIAVLIPATIATFMFLTLGGSLGMVFFIGFLTNESCFSDHVRQAAIIPSIVFGVIATVPAICMINAAIRETQNELNENRTR